MIFIFVLIWNKIDLFINVEYISDIIVKTTFVNLQYFRNITNTILPDISDL
jgi:hypothetical protein